MTETLKIIGGILIFLAPYFLIFGFRDRRRGFLCILTADIAFHIAVALITQALHIFIYPVVIGLNIAAVAAAGLLMAKKTGTFSFKTSLSLRSNWLIVVAFLIIFFNLWSVHHDYSGLVSTINGKELVSNSRYDYPYFSDEWSGVAYVNYTINQNSLPTVNPLLDGYGRENAPNIFVVFFSLLAELFLLINIVPLTGYAILALVAGMTICYLIYRLMRENGVSLLPALIAALSLPYIANGANLPGLWYLLPFSAGTILFLSGLIAISRHEIKLALAGGLLSLLLYPPLIVLAAPTFTVWILSDGKISARRKSWLSILAVAAIISAAAVIFIAQEYDLKNFRTLIVSYLWRLNLDNGIASFPIWRILPFWIWPFALIGLIKAFEKKSYFLLAPLLTGLGFWLFYNYSAYFFIIDYARVVVITSWLIIVWAGFGLNRLFDLLEKSWPRLFEKKARLLLVSSVLVLFSAFAFLYTERTVWTKLTLTVKTPAGKKIMAPAAPANHYLIADDLYLFGLIPKNIRFISPPWKGLVIGAATDNYPANSKPSIITNNVTDYYLFLSADCEEKIAIAKKFRIDYTYSAPLDCPDFRLIGHSRENLYLYELPINE